MDYTGSHSCYFAKMSYMYVVCICISMHFFFIMEFTQLELVAVARAFDEEIVEINQKRRLSVIQLGENSEREFVTLYKPSLHEGLNKCSINACLPIGQKSKI